MSDGNGALPEGWAATTVGEIATIKGGKRLPRGTSYADEPTPHAYIRVSDFHNGTIDSSDLRYITAEVQRAISRYTISSDDVYISIAGTIGVVGRVPAELDGANLTENAAKIVLAQGIDPSYLQRVLTSPEARSQIHFTTIATTQPKLALFRIAALNVPIAPLAEQRRIVSKIESLQERSSRARRALSEVGPLLAQFRQSVLRAAFSGRLTADWRAKNPNVEPATELLSRIRTERRHRWEQSELAKYEAKGKQPPKNWQDKYKEPEPLQADELEILHDQSLPEGWLWTPAELIVEPEAEIVYGIVQPGKKLDEGVPYVRGKDIVDGVILVDQLLKTSEKIAAKYERASLKGGDVLLGIIRATKVAIVPDVLEGANITQGTARFRPSGIIRTKFLAGWLDSPSAQNWLHDHYRGIDMPGLNLRDVRRLPVPIAPLAEQEALELQIETAIEAVANARVQAAESESALTQLDQSILAKAFRGELVPQDPNDEPASQLLARIRTTRDKDQQMRRSQKRLHSPKDRP